MASLPKHIREPDPQIYWSDNYAVLDYETSTIDFGNSHLDENETILASVTTGPEHPSGAGTWRFHGTPWELGVQLTPYLDEADFIVAHHAKFECGWMERGGLQLGDYVFFCTKLAETIIAGNRKWDFSLDACLKRRGWQGKDMVGRLIRMGVDTYEIPRPWLGHYCDLDTRTTEMLFLDQREELEQSNLIPTAYSRNLLIPVLYSIEDKGLCLDAERVHLVYAWHEKEHARLLDEWMQLTGNLEATTSKPKLRELLYTELKIPVPKDDRGRDMVTPKGKLPSTDVDALKRLRPRSKKAKAVVAKYREINKVAQALSKTIRKLEDCANNEGFLYADFNQDRAGTHRLSSSGRNYKIQLQNFQNALRPLVRPRHPGWFMGDGDSAGIEFRAAVDLAKDDKGLQDIKDGVDVHANTASIVFADEWDTSLAEKEGTNDAVRKKSKAFSFKPLYGGFSGTQLQQDYFTWFRERYSRVADMQRGWTETVLRHKQLVTDTGLTFYWPDCKMSRDGKYIKYTTNIYDYPVQYIATGLMCPTATVMLWYLMRAAKMESFLVNLVHDSAVGEIHPDEREQWTEYLQYCFNEWIVEYLKTVHDYEWTTPLESEVNIYSHWDDDAPEKWDAQWDQAA